MSRTTAARDYLARSPLFASLPPEAFDLVASRCRDVSLQAQDILFHQNDRASAFYLVVGGLIKLSRASADGQEKVIHFAGSGDTFAEAVMFMRGTSYPVTAQALEATELIAIPGDTYVAMLQAHPDACMGLLARLSSRLHERLRDIDRLTFQQARPRIVRYLLETLPASESSFHLPAAKQVVASRLSVTPETLSRVLHGLVDEGLLRLEGRRIEVLDRAGLEATLRDE